VKRKLKSKMIPSGLQGESQKIKEGRQGVFMAYVLRFQVVYGVSIG
jgi:hypothetical protein